ncbi:MAG: MATE family efflux transporter [Treponema sp.]|nr:MATE family efflux transporter [Treponema sp.]
MIQNISLFEKDPVPKAVFKLAVPTVISMMVTVLYNMVDTFFVGQTGDPNQVAAVSVATPVFLLLMAVGNMFGVGGATFLSRALGEKNYDKVSHISSFCFYGGIAAGIAGGAVFLLFSTPIMTASGASHNTLRYACTYLQYIAWGAPAIVLSSAFSNLVRGEGSAKISMNGMMLGTIANIILDPVFILDKISFGPAHIDFLGMGVVGAAIATVIGNILTVAYYLVYILKGKSLLSLRLSDFMTGGGILTGVIAIGLPASINNILMSTSNIILNKFLAAYGDIAIASMGIAMKANMLVAFVQLGLAMGSQPLIGYNYGSRNFKRMKSIMRFTMICNIIAGTTLMAVYLVFTDQIVAIFIDNREVIEQGILMLRALMLSAPVLGIMFVFEFTFQALGKAVPTLVLSISRQGFVFIPMLFIGRLFAGLNGIIFAQPVADILAVFISLGMFLKINKELRM